MLEVMDVQWRRHGQFFPVIRGEQIQNNRVRHRLNENPAQAFRRTAQSLSQQAAKNWSGPPGPLERQFGWRLKCDLDRPAGLPFQAFLDFRDEIDGCGIGGEGGFSPRQHSLVHPDGGASFGESFEGFDGGLS